MIIRPARPGDAAAITRIYAPYVAETPISLQDATPDEAEIGRRMAACGDLYPWLVADVDGAVGGYAYASPFRVRLGYRFTVETTVYVAPEQQRRGVARALYAPLIKTLIAQGFTQAIAAISLPNEASVSLHERFGFERCGVYSQVGWKLGQWWDVGLWQRSLAPVRTPPDEPLPWREGNQRLA